VGSSTRRKRRRRWLGALASAPAIWFLVHTVAVVADGWGDDGPAHVDVAVVLGTKVEPTGEPSARLRGRLARALALFQDGRVDYVLVSGALGREGHQEADVMAETLRAQGVPVERLLIDPRGATTWDTAVNAQRLMARRGLRSAVAVSDYFHLSRCKLAFRRAGIEQVSTARAAYLLSWRDPYSLLREFAGWYTYAWRDYPEPLAISVSRGPGERAEAARSGCR
jgi:vancomycin permeability regulator SanA